MAMHRTGRVARLLPLVGTLVLATAELTASAQAEDHLTLGLADIQAPAPLTENAGSGPQLDTLASAPLVESQPADPEATELGTGMASYYGDELAGRRTASGERFNPDELTAAHRTLPFGSKVRVTNPKSGKSVVVRINDRGPFTRGRLIDVSEAAARQIGLVAAGHGPVKLALLDR